MAGNTQDSMLGDSQNYMRVQENARNFYAVFGILTSQAIRTCDVLCP
jgi:hypothetical protein